MPDTIATIIAVSTDAMILFHSNDDIIVLFGLPGDAGRRDRGRGGRSRRAAGNRIPPINSTELSRFRRAGEPGMLSLPSSCDSRPMTATVDAAPIADQIANPIVLIPA